MFPQSRITPQVSSCRLLTVSVGARWASWNDYSFVFQAEKAKNLLFQAKYGRFGLGDPFIALQRDSENMKDNSFDEPAIKSMYDNQLAQLENLIATQRKAQLKMREQLASAEKRYHKVMYYLGNVECILAKMFSESLKAIEKDHIRWIGHLARLIEVV